MCVQPDLLAERPEDTGRIWVYLLITKPVQGLFLVVEIANAVRVVAFRDFENLGIQIRPEDRGGGHHRVKLLDVPCTFFRRGRGQVDQQLAAIIGEKSRQRPRG